MMGMVNAGPGYIGARRGHLREVSSSKRSTLHHRIIKSADVRAPTNDSGSARSRPTMEAERRGAGGGKV